MGFAGGIVGGAVFGALGKGLSLGVESQFSSAFAHTFTAGAIGGAIEFGLGGFGAGLGAGLGAALGSGASLGQAFRAGGIGAAMGAVAGVAIQGSYQAGWQNTMHGNSFGEIDAARLNSQAQMAQAQGMINEAQKAVNNQMKSSLSSNLASAGKTAGLVQKVSIPFALNPSTAEAGAPLYLISGGVANASDWAASALIGDGAGMSKAMTEWGVGTAAGGVAKTIFTSTSSSAAVEAFGDAEATSLYKILNP